MRLPVFRLGLLIIIGSVFASVIQFYIGLGTSMSDLSHEAPSTTPRDLFHHFTDHFLFAGTVPGLLFWIGLAIMILGIVRNFVSPRTKR